MQEPTQFNNGEGHWGWGKDRAYVPRPSAGVGMAARGEGVLTESREGLVGSPDQVVGQRPAV